MMAIDLAQRRVNDFQQRCGSYGETALHLAYHAALPVALNAELLHLLRINFFLDPPEPLPPTVEFEFLLSPLCREIDEGLYEIEPDIRDRLLAGLSQTYGAERTKDIASLLWEYVDHHSPWGDRVELERAQQLTALNFLNPQKAQQWLAEVETEVSQGRAAAREWYVAMRQEVENQIQHRQAPVLAEIESENDLPTKDFFISYTLPDRAWAEWIAWVLEETGHSVFLDVRDLRAGESLDQLQQIMIASRKVIVVLSENYLQSTWTQAEWAQLLAQDPTGEKRKLIPIRVGECRPIGLLAQIVYLDLVGVAEAEARQRLLTGVENARRKPLQRKLDQVPFPGTSELTPTEMLELALNQFEQEASNAVLRSLSNSQEWTILGDVMRIGRSSQTGHISDNDVSLPPEEGGISRQHAEISCRYSGDNGSQPIYFLRDFSRYGTWMLTPGAEEWQKIQQQEVILLSGTQLKFGSLKNSILEFLIAETGV